MNTTLLRETFWRVKQLALGIPDNTDELEQCEGCIDRAIDLLVEEIDPRIRLLAQYKAKLRSPVIAAFKCIDEVIDKIPDAMQCSRKHFVSDPRTNAFFANPEHITEVFSSSKEVRSLFDASPLADECWGLLCMQKQESRHLGVALESDQLRHDVMQTHIGFFDHQVISPGLTEEEARQALKCCIFKSLIAFMQREIAEAKKNQAKNETQRRVLVGRIRSCQEDNQRVGLEQNLEQLDARILQSTRFKTLKDHFDFIRDTLQNPDTCVRCRNFEISMNRMGVQISEHQTEGRMQVPVTEITVTSHPPRIAALARFPREELLPTKDFVREADIFLAT